ncbi:hypothetical protein ACJX0J_036095, partial [Zea mays]
FKYRSQPLGERISSLADRNRLHVVLRITVARICINLHVLLKNDLNKKRTFNIGSFDTDYYEKKLQVSISLIMGKTLPLTDTSSGVLFCDIITTDISPLTMGEGHA